MKSARALQIAFTSFGFLCLAACGNLVSLGGGSGGADPGGGAAGPGGGGEDSTVSSGSGVITTTSTGTGQCGADPNADADLDGFSSANGDCNDCDPLVNPNAVEVPTTPGEAALDEDCDGSVDNVAPACDQNLALDDPSPLSGAKAIDLCKVASGPDDWGLVDAKYTLPDGSPLPAGNPSFDLGHGLFDAFGAALVPKVGARMLALSSGTARRPGDPDYYGPSGGFSKDYECNHPPGFPKESPACPDVTTGNPYDGVALEVTVRAPSNAIGFSFVFNFFTAEWPTFICSSFNDVFGALLSPIPPGQSDGNISFDSQGNVITVNNVFVEACGCSGGPPCNAGGATYACSLGAASLIGTGFDGDGTNTGASTDWLKTTAPIDPGSTITMRFTVYDSGDGLLDTTTLVDGWEWVIGWKPPPVSTIRKPAE